MTSVSCGRRSASHLQTLNAAPLRGEGDPGEPYPLNNPPSPNGPGIPYVAQVVFSHMFSPLYLPKCGFTTCPEVLPHAADPPSGGGGRAQNSLEKAMEKRCHKKRARGLQTAQLTTQRGPKYLQNGSQNAAQSLLGSGPATTLERL